MDKWTRAFYQPPIPLGENGKRVTASEAHLKFSKEAAKEGMVLLKNNEGVLPLEKGAKIALFGKATFDYVKGGGGSGDVTVSHVHNLYDGFKSLDNCVCIFEELAKFYEDDVKKQYEAGKEPGMTVEPEIPADLLQEAASFTDTAVISICRFSGEAWDRADDDFNLTAGEQKMVDDVVSNFKKVIVVLNVGGIVASGWFKNDNRIQSVLLAWQGGMEGGCAAAELLLGAGTPSGKLPDTFAQSLSDYPSSYNFHDSDDYVEYTDDIFVGYRYFETIPEASKKVNYPFGFGLSYTEFNVEPEKIKNEKGKFELDVTVTNVGHICGKEVVQVYCEPASEKMTKSARVLVAFQKTDLLSPGQKQTLTLTFDEYAISSFDDIGVIKKSAYVLEKGDYRFHIGTSVRDTVVNSFVYSVTEDKVIRQHETYMEPTALTKRLKSDGSFENVKTKETPDYAKNILEPIPEELIEGMVPAIEYQPRWQLWSDNEKVHTLKEVADNSISMDEFLAQLSDRTLMNLLGGQPNLGVADTFGFGNFLKYGIPSVMTADGPAGLRIRPDRGVCTTAWPCATLLASTWDEKTVGKVGQMGGAEVLENNIAVWLTPAINIHRTPLCGRNFEYYSEDPLVAGTLAAAMVKGIQSNNVGASVKHFALNNKETNRKDSDSRASARAIREIYLKPFEIVVKTAKPWTVMTSYNKVNGQRSSECKELLDGILRGEWGFDGIVTTDWWNKAEHYKELLAGNDIKMGCGYPERLEEAMEKGEISRDDLLRSVKRLLYLILKLD